MSSSTSIITCNSASAITSTTTCALSSTPPPSPKTEICKKVLKIHIAIIAAIKQEQSQNGKTNFWASLKKTPQLLRELNVTKTNDLQIEEVSRSTKASNEQLSKTSETLRTHFTDLCTAIKTTNLGQQYQLLCSINACLPFSKSKNKEWVDSLCTLLPNACQFHAMLKLLRPYQEHDGSYVGIISQKSMIEWMHLWINNSFPYTAKEQSVLLELALVYALFYDGPHAAQYTTDLSKITKRLCHLENDKQLASLTDSVFIFSASTHHFVFLKFNTSTSTLETPVDCKTYELWQKFLCS